MGHCGGAFPLVPSGGRVLRAFSGVRGAQLHFFTPYLTLHPMADPSVQGGTCTVFQRAMEQLAESHLCKSVRFTLLIPEPFNLLTCYHSPH